MKIAAYCRVSTDKSDQLNSLQTQKQSFQEYAARSGDKLVRLYADEGLSGTKIKNRRAFQQMMADAELGLFEQVVVKDISRFARNTVDLLQNLRKLRALGIEMRFLTANMTSMEGSEFVLTIFGALAQEESANTSKRIKFGKQLNMEQGRVPNLVYGYDKHPGDLFHLSINQPEAEQIRRMFRWYVSDGMGASRIAAELNRQGVTTKRGCRWTQSAVCRILSNELYTGTILNGKQEVSDFLTSARRNRDRSEWYTARRPELRIIEQTLFDQAQRLMAERAGALRLRQPRHSGQHCFSGLIRCKCCASAFRRLERSYKNTYVRWVCSRRNNQGVQSCPNATAIDETALFLALQQYCERLLDGRTPLLRRVILEVCREQAAQASPEAALRSRLDRQLRLRRKYLELYADELITHDELQEKLRIIGGEITRLEQSLQQAGTENSGVLQAQLLQSLQQADAAAILNQASNAQLRRLLARVEAGPDGTVEIYLKPLEAPSAAQTVPDCSNHT